MMNLAEWQWLYRDGAQMLVLMALSISCAFIGVWLVLRKMAMLANSLSHTVLIGIVVAWLLAKWLSPGQPPSLLLLVVCSAAVSGLTTFTTHFFHRTIGLQEDASIGLVFSGFFALGVMMLSWTFPHSHIGIEIIMGNADAIVWQDLQSTLLLLLINVVGLALLHKEYEISTFDRSLAKAMGFAPAFLDFILMTQLTLTIMVGFRAVGSFLILAFLVGPALCARLFTHQLKWMIIGACMIAAGSSLLACLLARLLLEVVGSPVSTAGLTCTLLLLFFLIALGWQRLSLYRRRHYFLKTSSSMPER